MKKNFLLSALLFFTANLSAQNYLPMAVENAHWIVYSLGEILPNHHFYTVKGDTAINGLAYKKIWRRPILNFATSAQEFQPPFLYGDSIVLVGALRDDTLARRVYCVPFQWLVHENDTCDIFEEWLIHDYAVQVGETLGGCLHSTSFFPATVQAIGTENLWGADRRVIESDAPVRLVEGVGTEMGPFWAVYALPNPGSPTFLYDYCVGEEGECGLDYLSSTRQRLADWHIQLSPNPATDLLTVTLPEGQQGAFTLTVFDFLGKMVFEKSIANPRQSLQIPVAGLPTGLYLFSLRNENGVATRRFAKQ